MNERELFAAALELPSAADRRAFLDDLPDPAVRQRIEQLLQERAQLGSFLEHPPLGDVAFGPDATILQGAGSTYDDAGLDDSLGLDSMNRNPAEHDDEIDLSFLEPSARTDSLGRLAHYEILEVIGRGAFGTVLKAFDEKLQRVVAIKVLAPELAAASPARKRFLREARSSAQVRHENVVAIYAVEDEPIPYLVMEYIPGDTLQKRLDDHGPLALPDVLRIGKQIADGLAAAHAQDLIHRDVKPGNVLLDTSVDDHVKLTDFGLARTADDASMTQSGMIAGTPLYMAPEQALGHKLDQRADLFSFGSVLYQMLSGRPPFRAPSTIAVLKRVTEDTPRPIPEIIPEVPEWMCELVGHLHAKNPDERYGSAKEVSRLLATCLADVEQGRVPNIPAPRHPTAAEETLVEQVSVKQQPQTRAAQRAARWPWLRVAALVLIVLLAGLGISEATGVSHLATTVIRLTTGSGTLVIETDDPGIQVTVSGDGDEVTIRGAGIEQLTLRPGDYTVTASKDGKPVKRELVSITRNGRSLVRMSLETASADARPANPKSSNAWNGWPTDAPPPAIAPFDAEQARRHQQAWADYLGVPVEYENSLGMKFRLIPPGEFLMGSTPAEIVEALKELDKHEFSRERIHREGPQHKVILTQPIYIGVTEVTQTQYEQVMGSNPSHFSATGGGKEVVANMKTEHHPVEMVSWNDAAEFCVKLSQREQLKPSYVRSEETVRPLVGTGYRLPTEAEWEYACRAGTTTLFWSGDTEEDLISVGWRGSNSDERTHAVGELKANPFGLHDMHGNVWEWVQDGLDPSFYAKFEENAAVDPSSPFSASSQRMFRGGSWTDRLSNCRSSARSYREPTRPQTNHGFRVVLPVDAVKQRVSAPPAATTAKPHQWPADAPLPAIAPFDAEQAKQHQQAWADYLGVPVEYTNSIGMKFRLIPPGEFLMGSTPDEIEAALEIAAKYNVNVERNRELIRSEGPRHEVVLTQPLYLGVTEVTQAQYEQVMGTNPSHFSAGGEGKDKVAGLDAGNHPVEKASWYDAAEFCAKLSRHEALKPFYSRAGNTVAPLEGTGYRLPTEAEWEFACRAGTTTRFWTGDQDADVIRAGWVYDNSGQRTHPVAELKENPFGLYDVHGNVEEWVEDAADSKPNKYIAEKQAVAPDVPSSDSLTHMIRGGHFSNGPLWSRSSARHVGGGYWHASGFRVVLSVDAVTEQPSGKPAATVVPPLTDADVERIAALPAEQQIEEVRRELIRRNPGFDGNVKHEVEDGVVTKIEVVTDDVTDISPLRALRGLRTVSLKGSAPESGRLSDLSPLKGMALDGASLSWNPTLTDLSPLEGMPISSLGLEHTNVGDIAILKDMSIKRLWIHKNPVADLSPLAGKSLEVLMCHTSGVKTLHGLTAAKVEKLYCELALLPDKAELERLGVKEINGKPAGEFWKEAGAIEPQPAEEKPPTETAPP